MSVICQNFVQNAWRKDLCSNCFKSEADHAESRCRNSLDRLNTGGRYIPQAAALYQSRGIATNIHWRPLLADTGSRLSGRLPARDFGSQTSLLDDREHRQQQQNDSRHDSGKGILKDPVPKQKPRRSSVGFSPEEPLVIGYGGNDYDSDESPWEMGSDDGSINLELLDLTEEDRNITMLTKNNTEFNSVNENLIPSPPPDENSICSKSKTSLLGSTLCNKTADDFNRNRLDNEKNNKNITSIANEIHDNKLEYYYFSTTGKTGNTQQYANREKSNLLSQAIDLTGDCKQMSIIAKDIPGILSNIENNNFDQCPKDTKTSKTVPDDNSYKHNPELCEERNTNDISLSSKHSDNSEAGSDSDYSTSKQNNGESSTDSESFHDAEDMPMIPCSSFLHGKVPENADLNNGKTRKYAPKPFETSSVSSSDMSTFSDDSDCQRGHEDSYNEARNDHVREVVYERKVQNIDVANKNRKNISSEAGKNNDNNRKVTITHPKQDRCESATYKSVPLYIHKKSSQTEREESSPNRNMPPEKTSQAKSGKNGVSNSKGSKIDKHQEVSSVAKKEVISDKVQEKEPSQSKSKHLHDGEQRPVEDTPHGQCETKPRASGASHNQNTGNIPSKKVPVGRMSSYGTTESPPSPSTNMDSGTALKVKQQTTEVLPQALPSENDPRTHSRPTDVSEEEEEAKPLTPGKECDRDISHSERCSKRSIRSTTSSATQYSSREEDRRRPESTSRSDSFRDESGQIDSTDSNSSSTRSSPNSMQNRQSKLAALALELEKARCDASSSSSEFKTCSSESVKYVTCDAKSVAEKAKASDIAQANAKYPSIRRGRSLVSSAQACNVSSLPDLLPETTTKSKKSRFSLKKLLKRGKDSDTLVINNPNEYNPKAWKNQTFDRSRLSLEILHPMDLCNDSPPSADSTPTEDKNHSSVFTNPVGRRPSRGSTQRTRSLSALPQLISCVSDIGELKHGDFNGTISSLDRPKVDITRKAGTVAERSKKYKAPRRTPSFSELRSPSTNSGHSITGGVGSQRPPKPPPPPRGKSLQPPPQPPSVPAPHRDNAGGNAQPLPSRPPPLKVPDGKECSPRSPTSPQEAGRFSQNPSSDYANLGDIRLNITPKKPQRPSAVSFAKESLEANEPESSRSSPESTNTRPRHEDNTYESLETQEEEDHYTYLDDIEGKSGNVAKASTSSRKNSSAKQSPNGDKAVRRVGDTPHQTATPRPACVVAMKKPWMDLQASYAAIAAANYESLAELITTAISEGLENLQKSAASLRWNDFNLESEEPIQILEDKIVYNACHKNEPKTKVTLMVTTQKQHNSQHGRNPPRPPILATFGDYLPRQYLSTDAKHHSYADTSKAIIYVLQRAKATTVSQFAQDSASFQANQHVHLRNACFVLLQLIHTLKSLQAEGIEEIDYDLGHILLLHTDVDKPPILVLLPGDKVYLTMADYYKADVATRKMTLCQTTLQLLFHLLQIQDVSDLNTCVVNGELLAPPVAHTFCVISKILCEEKASSLTQAKGLLEYMLWGPVDIKMGSNEDDIDVILQRWLDLQRAQMVKSIVSNLHLKISSHTGFHVYEEYQLIFLLQATVKSLKDIICKL